MTHETSEMRVLKIRGRRVNLLLLAQGRSRGLLLRNGFRDKAKAKVKVDHPIVVDALGLQAKQDKGHVSITISLNT